MALATWWTSDPLPDIPPLPGFRVSTAIDDAALASLNGISVGEVAARRAAGHRAYMGFIDGAPVTYGWVATREAGMRKAGFTPVGRLSFDADGRVALTATGPADRARAGAALLGVPLVREPLSPCWRCRTTAGHAGGCACCAAVSPDDTCACAIAPRPSRRRAVAPAPAALSPRQGGGTDARSVPLRVDVS